MFNEGIDPQDIKAARNYGIQFIRLAPDKFLSRKRDFLIGTADHYQGLVPEDLAALRKVLDQFAQEGIPVVLTMLSLPGCRWRQHNNNTSDLRLWTDDNFQEQPARFWYDLANALKNHPAIVGYNILNEPHPERIYDPQGLNKNDTQSIEANTLLHKVYASIIKAIRRADSVTPIIVDSSNFADAEKFNLLQPWDDPHILYDFHFYEPYSYTNYKNNKGRWKYPGPVPDFIDKRKHQLWNKGRLIKYMEPVIAFQQKHAIPSSHILVGEFGGHRFSKGLETYFHDLMSIFKRQGWHFAVYAFREDTWDGMDYELGNKKLPWRYWKDIEQGKKPEKHRLPGNPVFSILSKEWKK